jgi:ribosome assembly protein RRB1
LNSFFWNISDSDSESENDENLDDDPIIEHINVNHHGGINRIRAMPQNPGVVATMADTKHNHIFDLSKQLNSMMEQVPRVPAPTKPTCSFSGHRDEGFAVDWSSVVPGQLATGDCAGAVHVWRPAGSPAAPTWSIDTTPYLGHRGSVEDIQVTNLL